MYFFMRIQTTMMMMIVLLLFVAVNAAFAQLVWYETTEQHTGTEACGAYAKQNAYGTWLPRPIGVNFLVINESAQYTILSNRWVQPSLLAPSMCAAMAPVELPGLGMYGGGVGAYSATGNLRVMIDAFSNSTYPQLNLCATQIQPSDSNFEQAVGYIDPTPVINAFLFDTQYAVFLLGTILEQSGYAAYALANGAPVWSTTASGEKYISRFAARPDIDDCLQVLMEYACNRAMPSAYTSQMHVSFCQNIVNTCDPRVPLPSSIAVSQALGPFAVGSSHTIASLSQSSSCTTPPFSSDATQNSMGFPLRAAYDWSAIGASSTSPWPSSVAPGSTVPPTPPSSMPPPSPLSTTASSGTSIFATFFTLT
jgi:hypothetical protein